MKRCATSSTLSRNLGTTAVLIGSMLFAISTRGQTASTEGSAQIASVVPISPKAWQTIVIRGTHLGTNPPINGCPDFIRITDLMTNRVFPSLGPFGGCANPILVTSWTDAEIVIEGLPAFQRGQDAFSVGDMLKIEVRNPQQNWAPMAWYSVRVTPEGTQQPLPPAPSSQAPFSTQGSQLNALTLPAGTSIVIRMIDSVDSSKNKIGDAFHASLDSALVIGETVVAPKGADVYGKLAQAKSAGKISGGAELTLEMTGIRIGGNIVPVDCTDYDAVTKGRGKQSIARIGGGAGLGSIIGGIVGGGKGAAIGAGAGGAAGTAVQLATHGQQIRIPSETVLEFKLQNALQIPVASPEARHTNPLPSPTPESAALPAGEGVQKPRVTSESQCTGPGDTVVTNNTRGIIHVLSGTGALSGVSPTEKSINVLPGSMIDGSLKIRVLNQGPGFAVAPLIWTPSWGDLTTSWRLASSWIRPGQWDLDVPIKAGAPQNGGRYYIVLAFQLETNGASVASGTNWGKGQPVWGDGNDIGQFDSRQIEEAQKYGCTIDDWLSGNGHQLIYVPADAIIINVASMLGSNTSVR